MASETTSSTDEHIGVKDADVSILPRVAKLDSTSILKLKVQYDRYCAVVIDREGNRPEAARIKPQAIRFCFTTPQLTCIALNHLFLNNVDLLTDDDLEGWIESQIKKLPASHGLTTQDIEAKIANDTVDDLQRVVLEGIRVPYELDSGCRGGNIMPGHIAVQLKEATFRDVQQRDVTSAEGKVIGTITRTVQVPITILETEVGNLALYHVTFYVCDEIPVILFGDNLLTTLGINPRQQLENIIASGCTEMDTLSGYAAVDVDCIETVRRIAARMATLRGDHYPVPESDSMEPSSSEVDLGPINAHEIEASCNRMVHQARLNGMSRQGVAKLRLILRRHLNEFRTRLGQDKPVDVEPMVTQLKQDATPYRCKPRFYNPKQKEFLDDMISMLKENGLVYMNMNSRCEEDNNEVIYSTDIGARRWRRNAV
ncbi:Uncharacterized protein PBTT_03616 [Plasmodiophora brassicae]|uniref:Uncharacterized protein n=1 Tax=Plasmodiophora brassicae TaxID=37360 RepID=A0A0G4IJW7_PLABS|nr:hypothetical protein PBRA_009641 [Plasmodiophora brassicae]